MISCNIESLIEYIVCPAKCYISKTYKDKPIKELIRGKVKAALADVIIMSVNQIGLNPAAIGDAIDQMFSDLEYDNKERDRAETVNIFNNLDYTLKYERHTICDPMTHFEVSYRGTIISSYYDMVIVNGSNNMKIPVIIDISKTKYEPMYNPILYRCQTVVDYLNLKDTNTDVMVFSVATGKTWMFDKIKYRDILTSSIIETMTMITNDLYPARFSWICAGCAYRGICHNLIKTHSKTIMGEV